MTLPKTAKTDVGDYTRTLANGTQVQVHGHSRSYTPGVGDDGKSSPVEAHRRNRLKEQARARRQRALEQGGDAARRGAASIRKRSKQTARLAKRGAKRIGRGARYASRRRRTMAAACMVGGVAEIGAGLAWSTAGLIWTLVSIILSALGGALFLGGKKKAASPPPRPAPRAKTASRPTRRPPAGRGVVHPRPKGPEQPPSEFARKAKAFDAASRLHDEVWEQKRQEARRQRTGRR
ncbi:MAG TPA: hypothetical protein VG674_32005 [Amycolatopsis sp.]|nr:hypothetical protein [Amycolatopsis sp.]